MSLFLPKRKGSWKKLLLVWLFLFSAANLSAATVVDWKGTTSSNWATGSNWSTGSVPGTTDLVQIGVNYAFTNQPSLTTAGTTTIGTLTFGTLTNTTLTVGSGATLAVTGAIVQNPGNAGNITTTLAGAGAITGASLTVGNTTSFPPVLAIDLTEVISTINSLHITGGVNVESTDFGVLFVGVGFINATFSLQGGTTLIDGQILTLNTNSGVLSLVFATPTFSIDMPAGSTQTPVLQLSNTAAINTSSVAGTIDFFNNTGGTGTCTVNYVNNTGTTQTLYTNSTAAMTTSPQEYQYLTTSGTGSQTPIGTALTVGANLTTSSGSVLLNTNNPTVTVNGNWTNSANTTQGTGNITISGSVTNNSGGTLGLGSANLYIGGNYTNNVGGVYTQSTGTTYFTGTGAQALVDNSTTGTTFNNVIFNGGGTATMSAGTNNVNFLISNTGLLTMANNSVLTAGTTATAGGASYLTLTSGSSSSATVAAMTGTAKISGNVNVQRYYNGGTNYRGYRLISSPVYAGAANSNNVYSINYLQNSAYLTGTASGGFDKTGNPTLYLYREDQVPSNATFISGNFWGISAINNSPAYNYYMNNGSTVYNIPVGDGVMFFFRGNRASASVSTETTTTYVPVTATTTTTGFLNQGQITPHDWYTPTSAYLGYTGSGTSSTTNYAVRGFNLVGNPYASSIDWEQYQTATTTTGIYAHNVGTTIYEFNSQTHNYNTYQKGGSHTNNGTNIIVSGQGFFVLAANSTSPQLIFNESAKTNAQNTGNNLFMTTRASLAATDSTATDEHIRLQMAADSVNTDDTYIGFNQSASSQYNMDEDGRYLKGQGLVSMASYSSDSVRLAINKMPLPSANQTTIPLFVTASNYGTYQLNMTELVGIPQLYDVWLMDRFMGDSLDMRHNSSYVFNVTTDTNSYGANRFQLVIRQNPSLMVHLLSFTANKASGGAQTAWTTENEANYTNFSLQRSTDNGATFNTLDAFESTGVGSYNYLDKAPANGTDEYRLQTKDLNGNISYSNTVSLVYSGATNQANNNISVYPNPAGGTINVAINQTTVPVSVSNLPSLQSTSFSSLAAVQPAKSTGKYIIEIVSITGTIVRSATSSQPAWQGSVGNLAPGTYLMQVFNENNKTIIGRTTFVKL